MKYMEIHIGGYYKVEIHIQGGYYKIIRWQNSKDSQSSIIILVLGVSPQTFMFPHVHLTKNQFLRWKCGCLAILSFFGSPFWNGLTTKEPLIETAPNKLLNLENHDLTLREASLTRTSSIIKHHRTTQTMPVGLRVHTLPPVWIWFASSCHWCRSEAYLSHCDNQESTPAYHDYRYQLWRVWHHVVRKLRSIPKHWDKY